MICDFCSSPDPAHRIPCRSFNVLDIGSGGSVTRSESDFLACTICNGLILANNREGLIERARQSFIGHHGYWHQSAELQLRQFYKQFWENRIQ